MEPVRCANCQALQRRLHDPLVGPEATAYVIDPTRSGAVAEAILGIDYGGTLIHDGCCLTTAGLRAFRPQRPAG
jgi:hypothetical protein